MGFFAAGFAFALLPLLDVNSPPAGPFGLRGCAASAHANVDSYPYACLMDGVCP